MSVLLSRITEKHIGKARRGSSLDNAFTVSGGSMDHVNETAMSIYSSIGRAKAILNLNGFLGAKKMVYPINSSIVILLIILGRGMVSNPAAIK